MNAEEDGLVSPNGPRGNGARPKRIVDIRIQVDLDTGDVQLGVTPPEVIGNRFVMYGILEILRDIVYRQQLPGALAALQQASQRAPAIVVADGPLPPFHKR